MSVYLEGRLADVDPVILECLCLHQVLCELGYSSEQFHIESCLLRLTPEDTLFPERSKTGERVLQVVLRVGEKAWAGAIGPCAMSGEDLQRHWEQSREAFNGCTEEEARRLWEKSRARHAQPVIESALRKLGISPRGVA